ncbi:MAG: VanW family protein [Oscillospiraceae bacterium]|nr:VanW family protein [Oscillospiraceae bacterium]
MKLFGNNKKTKSSKNFSEPEARRVRLWPFITAAAVIAAIIVAATVVTLHVNNIDTVYPKLTVNGIQLGGLTKQEASDTIARSMGSNPLSEADINSVGVTVRTNTEQTLTLTGDDLGFDPQDYSGVMANYIAGAAMNYGRDSSPIKNAIKFIRCSIKPVNLAVEPDLSKILKLNSDTVYEKVYIFAEDCNAAAVGEKYEIKEKEITIHRAAEKYEADPDEMYNEVMKALDKSLTIGQPTEVEYEMKLVPTESIDLKSIYDSIYVEPVDAYFKGTEVIPEVVGVSFDLSAAEKSYKSAASGTVVTIPLIFTQPEVLSKDLGVDLFKDVLVEKSTSLSGSSSNRITNITLAASYINGTVLGPGETFSFNGTVGERTPDKGFKEAGAYAGGKTIQEYGGGICQVSSTIYYCCLKTNMEIVERYEHMFAVGYLPMGMDATVSWGYLDFKFANSSTYPIKIEAYVSGGDLTVRFYGTKTSTDTMELDYVVTDTIDYEVIEKEDPSVTSDSIIDTSGHTGYVVETYKYIYDKDGNLKDTVYITTSEYDSQDRVILIPVRSSSSGSESSYTPSAPADSGGDSGSSSEPGSESGGSGSETGGDTGSGGDSGGETVDPGTDTGSDTGGSEGGENTGGENTETEHDDPGL